MSSKTYALVHAEHLRLSGRPRLNETATK